MWHNTVFRMGPRLRGDDILKNSHVQNSHKINIDYNAVLVTVMYGISEIKSEVRL
jgi:hypothetical protein